MKSFTNFKNKLLKDKAARDAYDALGAEYELVAGLIEKRLQKGLTQQALARKVGTKQPAIARLESGEYNPSIAFLGKVAKALGSRLTISLT